MAYTHADASATLYDSIAPQYDQQLTRMSGDHWVRAAFHAFVATHVSPGAHLFDFGCGTGTDALWYASKGYTVVAYDNSPGMINELQHKCSAEIVRGQITCSCAPYVGFLSDPRMTSTLSPTTCPTAITANFAVLNLIHELTPLFDTFGQLLAPHGRVLVSVLNPFFWKEMIHPSWWKANRMDFKRQAMLSSRTANVVRHTVARIDKAAAGVFERIDQTSVGTFISYSKVRDEWGHAKSLAARIESGLWRAPVLNATGKYLFLAYRRLS